jgi:hypothetical protein
MGQLEIHLLGNNLNSMELAATPDVAPADSETRQSASLGPFGVLMSFEDGTTELIPWPQVEKIKAAASDAWVLRGEPKP